MKLIIDIPEKTYKNIIEMCMFGSKEMMATIQGILNGKLLQIEIEEIKNDILQDGNYQIGEDFSEYITDYQNLFDILDKHIGEK